MNIYKVVEIKQKSLLKGIMTAYDLQQAINQYAIWGWELDRLTSGETQGFVGGKDVFLIIFRMKVEIPDGLFVMINNQSVGPVTEFILSDLLQKKLIEGTTSACIKGMNEWKPLSAIAPKMVQALFS